MNLALVMKNVSDSRLVLLACFVILFAFCWIRVWIVSQLEMSRFEAVISQIWDKWGERFATVPLNFILTYPGRISLGFVEPVVTFGMAVWVITRGSDVVSGELGRGTMEMLLSQPVSRLQVLLTQAFFTVAGVAVLAGAAWLGTFTGVMVNSVEEEQIHEIKVPLTPFKFQNPLASPETVTTPLVHYVDPRVFLPAVFNLFAYGVCLAGIATFLSSWDIYRWRTIGLGVGVLLVAIICKLVGMAVKGWAWLKYTSFLAAYEPERFTMIAQRWPDEAWAIVLHNGHVGPFGYSAILLAIGLAGYAAAAYIFCHRDLPAPL